MRIRTIDRRGFLASLACLPLLPACGGSDDSEAGNGSSGAGGSAGSAGSGGSGGGGNPGPEPPPWTAPGTQDEVAFAWSIQTGDATPDSVMVGCRTTEPGVTLSVMRGVQGGWEEVSSGTPHTAVDGVVQLELTELAADTTYALAFFSSDGSRRSRVARLRTALAPGASRVLRFGASSCLGGAGRPWLSLGHAANESLDFFMLLGDTIYGDGSVTSADYAEEWKSALATQGLADLTTSTSVIGTWDDHELDNDWLWTSPDVPSKFDAALPAFRQAIPQRLGSGGTKIWRKLSWGRVLDVFVLDCRGERRDGNYMSAEQMSWIKQELSASTAVFKVVMNSVPILDFTGTPVGAILANDRWQGFPAQRTELLTHVRDAGVRGVLWVSGDFHIGGAGMVSNPGEPGEDQIEILTGPAGSNINPAAGIVTEGGRILSIVKVWNYVLFEADPDAGSITARFIGDDAQVVREHVFELAT